MHRADRRMILLAVGLAALAGMVDALGYLALHGFFVSLIPLAVSRPGEPLDLGPWRGADRDTGTVAVYRPNKSQSSCRSHRSARVAILVPSWVSHRSRPLRVM